MVKRNKIKTIIKLIIFSIFLSLVILVFVMLYGRLLRPLHCSIGGGNWERLGSTCVDRCYKNTSTNTNGKWLPTKICGLMSTDGCNCGENKCWNGIMCRTITDN